MQESPYLEGRQDLLKSMRMIPAFSSLSDENLGAILSLSKIRKYDKGEVIIEEGGFDSWMYFIITGGVKVLKNGKKLCNIAEAGAVFGEMGVIDGCARSATVQAHTDAMCLAVDAAFLDRMQDPQRTACHSVLYRMFVEILAERLRMTSAELADAKEKMAVMRQKNHGRAAIIGKAIEELARYDCQYGFVPVNKGVRSFCNQQNDHAPKEFMTEN